MKAQMKCSNCGAEITNLNMGWGKKQWLWLIPFIILMMAMPLFMEFMLKDNNDFRSDLSLKDIEKQYTNGTIEIVGVIENNGQVDWENIVVEAELFSFDNKFLDELTR